MPLSGTIVDMAAITTTTTAAAAAATAAATFTITKRVGMLITPPNGFQ
jgi:hypothetical protein